MKSLNNLIRTALLALVLTHLNLWNVHGATIVVTATADSGPGSLRQAILDANADTSPGDVDIEFNIPGSGVQTLAPLTPLPAITRAVTIDGYTQPGASPNTLANANNAVLLIELNGANVNVPGLNIGVWIKANDCVVRGLVINRFGNMAILIQECDNGVFEGNFIGTDFTGNTPLGNLGGVIVSGGDNHRIGGLTPASRNIIGGNYDGIFLQGMSNQVFGNFIGIGPDGTTVISNTNGVYLHYCSQTYVGGATPAARNVISGNANGIWVNQYGTNVIQGNFIGTDASGTLSRGNSSGVVLNESAKNFVGGPNGGAGNLISGNLGQAVVVEGLLSKENIVAGNLIGTDVTGAGLLGNGDYGVLVQGAAGNVVGGTNPAAHNIIAGSGRVGAAVYSTSSTNNAIVGNSFFGNGLGIDLGTISPADLGPTPNDAGDPDESANHYQNFPEITSVQRAGRNLKVTYRVDSTAANSAYPLTVEFFIADAGQGRTLLHRATYSTPQAVEQITFKPSVLPTSTDQIVATATDANGNTSEFSFPVPGGGGRKVNICHEGMTISVDESALPAHLAHGDSLGSCP